MTYNPTILKTGRKVIPVLVMLLLGACQQDLPDGDILSGKAEVTLSVTTTAPSSAPAQSPTVTTRGIDDVSSIDILAFQNSRLVRVSPAIRKSGNLYGATLNKSLSQTDRYTLVILANAGTDIRNSLYNGTLAGKSETEVGNLLFDNTPATRLLPASTLPMCGKLENVKVEEGMSLSSSPVQVLRSVAKVEVGIGRYNETSGTWENTGGTVNFKLTNVQVRGIWGDYKVMPDITLTNGKPDVTVPNVRIPSTTDNSYYRTWEYDDKISTDGEATYCQDIIIPEAKLAPGTVYDAGHASNRLAVLIGGYYNGDQNRVRWYRIDFTAASSNITGTALEDVLRNHIYRFQVTGVTDPGYPSANDAYNSVPKGISFSTSIEPWKDGINNDKPNPQEGFVVAWGALNGGITTDGNLNVILKTPFWKGEHSAGINQPVDYADFYGEVPGNTNRSPAYPNGDIYPEASKALEVEGVYPSFMVSFDDVYSTDGQNMLHWKDGSTLTAFDICREYTGLGYTNWRLPRLSELVLIYLNHESLISQRGFSPLQGTYWSGSEKDINTAPVAAEAWAVNFDIPPFTLGGNKTTQQFKIRCVRRLVDEHKEKVLHNK